MTATQHHLPCDGTDADLATDCAHAGHLGGDTTPIMPDGVKLVQTGRDAIALWGQMTVASPADREAAMAGWKAGHVGYSPSIYPDQHDPLRAHWRRWNTCD